MNHEEISPFDTLFPHSLENLDTIQVTLTQFGFTIRGMRRRHPRGESIDGGKVEYLDTIFQAWIVCLGSIWGCLVQPGMAKVSAELVRGARGLMGVTEEVGAFVRDMDFAGVVFRDREWDLEARR